DALTFASTESDDGASPAELLAERTAPLAEELRERRLTARVRVAAAESRLAELTTESARLRTELDDSPTAASAGDIGLPGRTGAPLWRLVQFAEHIGEE